MINEVHASHIRRVYVEFSIEAPELEPLLVTERLGINPSQFARRGDERRNYSGDTLGLEENGWWQVRTEGIVVSKDINEHFHFLLDRLLPYRDKILGFAKGGNTYFGVLWQSTYLYAGTGPLIDPKSLAGVAMLAASMGFDMYQINEFVGEPPMVNGFGALVARNRGMDTEVFSNRKDALAWLYAAPSETAALTPGSARFTA